MKEYEEIAKAYRGLMPQEVASAANLLAHPLAGAAAFGALGLGIASHAFGLWLGTMAGAAETSRRMLSDLSHGEAERGGKAMPRLKLVSSREMPEKASPVRSGAAARKAAGSRAVKAVEKPAPKPARKAQASRQSGPARPKAIDKPAAPDDLKAISGIGPKLEKVLNGLGIWSHAQIAGLSAGEKAWLDEHLGFSGRIERDDWTGQAAMLARGRAEGK
ncbi:hypothetical protein [Aquamicrobium sp. LC103]|uniref:hypothetical protein n=1 Tax=Aquamicrobium sp. LC103 TaxID=1120658 RepID=UPI00063E7C6A|nr:hypothetical protein [Aquamicrobium sp. LC103]TKT79079.1 NADH-ubiquinone dehydrogenase [Aquamicrobium sp. LC103]